MLPKLSSLSIASLRKLNEEANKFYDRKHDFYHTALLTRCFITDRSRAVVLVWSLLAVLVSEFR